MPDTGAPHSLPWPPSTGVTPDVPRDMQTLAEQVAARLGFAGKSVISTAQARSSTSYGTLTTADSVPGVVLPTDGLIHIWYQALWKEAVTDDARAGLFIGSNQLLVAGSGDTSSNAYDVGMNTTTPDRYRPLATTGTGLVSGTAGGNYPTSYPTTGHAVGVAGAPYYIADFASGVGAWGGCCSVFAAAGTYTISVQFKSIAGGAVTVKDRRLWVHAMPF